MYIYVDRRRSVLCAWKERTRQVGEDREDSTSCQEHKAIQGREHSNQNNVALLQLWSNNPMHIFRPVHQAILLIFLINSYAIKMMSF